MCPFVNIILLVFISATGRIVLTNCESNDVGSGIVQTLEQLLLETRSNFDELRSEIQLLKDRMDRQLEMNVRLEERNSHIQLQTAQRLEMIERMLHRIKATDIESNIQQVQSVADHPTTTSGRHRLVSLHPVISQTLSGGLGIQGLAVMNNELYVGRRYVIEVYDVATLNHQRNLSIPGLRCVIDLASCPQCDVVYINDRCTRQISAVDQHGVVVSNWSVENWPDSLSVSLQFNVIATFPFQQMLREFTSRGEMIREITLQSDIMYPWHAIQLDKDRYAVVHGIDRSSLHRVCIINRNGTIIESYGGDRGSDVGQLSFPWRMLIFNGSMIVANNDNRRLLLFSVSPLQYIRELTPANSDNLKPTRMAITADGSQLFVAYDQNQLKKFDVTWS